MFGYPNYNPPKHMLEAFESVTSNDSAFEMHEYADFMGHHWLRAAVTEFNGILMNRKIDANKKHIIELRGGVLVYVPLRPRDGQTARQSNELTFHRKELESKFTNKTKMIWVNNPNNPSGKISTAVLAVPTPTQLAYAIGLEVETKRLNTNDSYFIDVRKQSMASRDKFLRILNETGVEVVKPNSGYFIMANFTNIVHKVDISSEKDDRFGFQFALWLAKHKDLFMFPGVMFYSQENQKAAQFVVRITFIKGDELINRFEKVLKSV
ncbi:unnamed protein product, partial [Oppiella nova]